ncbi:hypothetical protein ACIQ9M_34355 [Streptomyces californicus]|uniref:hypothetical protein n=1 Tax=Streptomyces californicus TaxID=67351 RepID=UPI0036B8ECBD
MNTATDDLDFPPLANGLDYLVSVVNHLQPDTGGTPSDIKYAVLHLQAAAEVLLKARLAREHWSLVFRDPAKATYDAFSDASFDSCTMTATVERLRNIAGLDISHKNADALESLAKDRNRLQHYGLTHNAKAVESRAAKVLDFLLDFVDGALIPRLTREEADIVAVPRAAVREGLSAIQSFVTKRMNRLRGEFLNGCEATTLRCPDCNQVALRGLLPGSYVPGDGNALGGFCCFCDQQWSANDLAYALQTEHQGSPLIECPDCHAPTLTDSADFADAKVTLYCTTCASRFTLAELGNCAACGCYCPIGPVETGRQLLCADCDRRIREEEEEHYLM